LLFLPPLCISCTGTQKKKEQDRIAFLQCDPHPIPTNLFVPARFIQRRLGSASVIHHNLKVSPCIVMRYGDAGIATTPSGGAASHARSRTRNDVGDDTEEGERKAGQR
jgi:hypothetical protein